MPLKIIFKEFNDDEENLRFYVDSSPIDPDNLPTPVDETGDSSTLTDESADHGADAVSHTVPWDETTEAYVRVSAVKGDAEVASQEFHFEPDGSGGGDPGGSDDYSTAQIGDEIGGGIYAGTDTIDGTDYHIIAGLAESEEYGLEWKTSRTTTSGTGSDTDGLANTLAMETAGLADHPAAAHCLAYDGGGYNDWHMPARSQLTLMYNNLRDHAEFADNVSSGDYTWASTEFSSNTAWNRKFSDGGEHYNTKDFTNRRVRPIRRVAV